MAGMTQTLVRMNLSVLRHSRQSLTSFWTVLGVLMALGTVGLALLDVARAVKVDLLVGALAVWGLVMAVAPMLGSGGQGLRAEHFALLPIPPRRLATGLLGAALAGIGPAIVLLALLALPVYGFQLSALAGLVGIAAALLQWVLVVLLARVVHGGTGAAMQTRLGMELVAFQFGLMFAMFSVGWFALEPVFTQINLLVSEGWPPLVSTLLRALPTGWGVVAVDAAGRGDWLLALGGLIGLAALIAALLAGWSALLARGTTARPTTHALQRGVSGRLFRRLPATPTGAVIAKELVAWQRDPWRALELRVALWTGLLIGAIPLLIGQRELLPFVGMVIAWMGGIVSCNLYALDGSALWQTLLSPGAARHDVRGRQGAWLLIFGPVSLAATALFTALSGLGWIWPLVLALTFATLGSSAGLLVYLAVQSPAPGIDPHLRRNPMDSSGDTLGQAFLMMFLVGLLQLPALAVVVQGLASESLALQWAGVLVGLATGALVAWWGGRAASRRLQAAGPELFNLLLRGASPQAPDERSTSGFDKAWNSLPRGKKIVAQICLSLCWLPLFAQGLAPLVLKVAGVDVKSWFLAMYVPEAYQWPVIFGMIALGAAMLVIALQIVRAQMKQGKAEDSS